MEPTKNHGGNFLAGILIGGLVGAAAGILLAPKAGKELRGELKGKADEVRALLEKAGERAKELKMEADRQLSEARLTFKRIFGGTEEEDKRYPESETGGDA